MTELNSPVTRIYISTWLLRMLKEQERLIWVMIHILFSKILHVALLI